MTELNQFPVKDLASRYNIGKTALYSRFKAAGVKPTKEGVRSVIAAAELEELDRLNDHIDRGGKLEDFQSTLSSELAIAPMSEMGEMVALVEAVRKAIAPAADPMANFRALEEAAREGWLLPTSVVQQLTGRKPKHIMATWGSFLIIKTEVLMGRERAWRVSKQK